MVKIGKSLNVESVVYDDGETVRGTEKRLLISPADGQTTFAMRRFTIGVGGHTPYHTHPWEHQVFVLSGSGEVRSADGATPVESGDYAFVPPMDEHQFVNTGDGPFEFICVVPPDGES
jgi:quercetin dioxygenase-like cupin family protein